MEVHMSRIKMNLTHKSLEDLHRMRVELDADLASVKMQLSEARGQRRHPCL